MWEGTAGSTQSCNGSPWNEATQDRRWPIACRKLKGNRKDVQMHLWVITQAHRLFKRSKTITCRELPPGFALSYKICLHYWPPTACYSHCCNSTMSCWEETKLHGKVCSWISLAIPTVLSTPWGFPAKIELSSTASEKIFRALRGFSKMQRQNIYATHGPGLSWPTVAWLLWIKIRKVGISSNAGGENESPVDLRCIKAKQLPKDNFRLKQTHEISTNVPV